MTKRKWLRFSGAGKSVFIVNPVFLSYLSTISP